MYYWLRDITLSSNECFHFSGWFKYDGSKSQIYVSFVRETDECDILNTFKCVTSHLPWAIHLVTLYN